MIKRPLKFGLCMEGCEVFMEALVREVSRRFEHPLYFEIGVAFGETLVNMTALFRDSTEHWTSVGVDIPELKDEYQRLMASIAAACELHFIIVEKVLMNEKAAPFNHGITVYLKPSQELLRDNWTLPIHLALIDGCHGKPCVKKDFELVSQFVPKGGFVVFHDFGQDSVGEPQAHCPTGDTLGACADLGLLANQREGWRYCGTIIGDKTKVGRDIGIFERV